MANTSLTLGEHWDQFIKSKVKDGRYSSASELIRDSLRLLEEHELKRESLIQALEAGEKSGSAGKLDMEAIKEKARAAMKASNA